jgi:hypothetical protein
MQAWKIVAGVSTAWILAAGCSMGQHSSFDAGPVWSQQGTPMNSSLDYRAGSILNRRGPGGGAPEAAPAVEEAVPPAAKPAPRAPQSARVTEEPTEELEGQERQPTVAERQPAKKAPAESRTSRAPPKTSLLPDAPLPDRLPPGMVAAPPGTKEGATRILSVTDRRLADMVRSPKPEATGGKPPQPTAQKSGEDLGGWHAVPSRQEPTDR